jgi:Lysine-specific metallo-endopeptidase/Bacteriophage T4 gp5 C-terminal trimerisation domain
MDRHQTVGRDQKTLIGRDKHTRVKGEHREKVEGDLSHQVEGQRSETVGTIYALESGQEIHIKSGAKVIIECGLQLSLVGAGGFIDIGPGGVAIQGSVVLVNSGGSPGSGTGSDPQDPEPPLGATVEGLAAKAGKAGAGAWLASRRKRLQQALKDQAKMLEAKKKELQNWSKDKKARANFKRWFGATDKKAREKIGTRIDKMIALNKNFKVDQFGEATPPDPNRFACVYPTDKSHAVYIDKAFDAAPATGQDSAAGTLSHEMSHFNDIGGTKDYIYGTVNAKALATTDSAKALDNADNFEYYLEDAK